MKNMKALIAVAIIATLFLSLVALSLAVDNDAISAEMLINNAERLDTLVKCRNSAIANSTDTTSLGAIWQQILNFTSLGEKYLNASKAFYEAGNYTAAKIDAIWAIRSFGNALRLQSLVASSTGINFTACTVMITPRVLVNGTRPLNATRTNRSRFVNIGGITIRIRLMKARISTLLNSSLTANDTQLREMLYKALQLLNAAEESLVNGNVARAYELFKAAEKIVMTAQIRIRINAIKRIIICARKRGFMLNISQSTIEGHEMHKLFRELLRRIHMRMHYWNMSHGVKPPVIMPHKHGGWHKGEPWNPGIPGPVMPFNMSPFNHTPSNMMHRGGGRHGRRG